MADKKISALTSATTPLAGTEVLPIVQSGATVKVAVSDLTAGRAISATAVTASTGNFIVGTAGQGVDFSINPAAAGMTSELFNDYEEGTWTPDITGDGGSAGSVAYTSLGYYTKVGRLVTLNGYVAFSNLGSWTGRVGVTGVPYSANTVQAYGSSLITKATVSNALNLNCSIGAVSFTKISFPWASNNGGGGDNIRFTDLAADSFVTFSITYITT